MGHGWVSREASRQTGRPRSYTHENLIVATEEVADECGGRPTYREMQAHVPPWMDAFLREFRSWNAALAAAGYAVQTARITPNVFCV